MALRYGYVQTRNRWHRVALDASGVRSIERCNLDDSKMRSRVSETEPRDARRCLHCHDEDEVPGDDEPPAHPRAAKRRPATPSALAVASLLAAFGGGVFLSPDSEVTPWASLPPFVVIVPGPIPSPSFPSPTPTSSPTGESSPPPSVSPARSTSPASPSTPRPSLAPTPCPHPGKYVGLDDPCKWKGAK